MRAASLALAPDIELVLESLLDLDPHSEGLGLFWRLIPTWEVLSLGVTKLSWRFVFVARNPWPIVYRSTEEIQTALDTGEIDHWFLPLTFASQSRMILVLGLVGKLTKQQRNLQELFLTPSKLLSSVRLSIGSLRLADKEDNTPPLFFRSSQIRLSDAPSWYKESLAFRTRALVHRTGWPLFPTEFGKYTSAASKTLWQTIHTNPILLLRILSHTLITCIQICPSAWTLFHPNVDWTR